MNGHAVIVHKSESSYLAHAGLVQRARSAVSTAGNAVKNAGSRARQNVKYFARELRPNGKYDYWYSLQEYRAHLQAQAKKSQQTAKAVADNVQGAVTFRDKDGNEISGKEAAKQVGNAAISGLKSKGHRMRDEFKKNVSDTAEKAENAAKKAVGTVKEAAETVKETGEKAVSSAKETAEKVADKAKETAEKTSEAVKDTVKEVSDQAKETAAKVSDKISEVADKIRKSNEPPKAELSPEGEEHVIEETVLPEKDD